MGCEAMNNGLRMDWLGVSLDGNIDVYDTLLDSMIELKNIPGIPMFGIGYECDGYRIYLQGRSNIIEKEVRLKMRDSDRVSNAYPLAILIFDHTVLWSMETGYIQSVIEGFEEMGCRHHITRVDLNVLCDLDMKYFSSDEYLNHVVCKSKKGSSSWSGEKTETIYFGDISNRKRILARIYDKRKEVEVSKKWYMLEGTEEWGSVTSVEFEMRRDGLKMAGINTINELLSKLYVLWSYCTEWLKFVDNEKKGYYQLWWDEIKGAVLVNGAISIKKRYEEREIDIERLYRIIRGYISTAKAIDNYAERRIMEMLSVEEKDIKDVVVYEKVDGTTPGGTSRGNENIPF